jgi:hypothetical protein
MSVDVGSMVADAYLIICGIIAILSLYLYLRWKWLDFTRKCPVCEHRRGWHFGGQQSSYKFYCRHFTPAVYAPTQTNTGLKYFHEVKAHEECKCSMTKDDIDLNF